MYKRAIKLEPQDATAYARLADLAWQGGQLNAASQLYATALQLDQTNPDALLGRARALALASETDASMLLVNDLIQTHGPSYQALALKAMLFDLDGDHASAQTLFLSAIDRKPKDPTLLSSLAYSNALEGEYRAAVDILRGLGEQQATAANAQYALADVYALSGQTGVAMELRKAAAGGAEVSAADRVFLSRLATLTPQEQARALYFRELPKLDPQSPGTQDAQAPKEPELVVEQMPEPSEPQMAVATMPPPEPAAMAAESSMAADQQPGEPKNLWVQMASFQSREALEIAWYQISRAHPDVAKRLAPAVETVDIKDKGTFHRLYAGGYDDKTTAKDVCSALRDAGLGCVIVAGTRETMTLAEALAAQ
jgi:Tfp pilus assembly protein PilF